MNLKIIGKVGCSLLLVINFSFASFDKLQVDIIDIHTKIKCYGHESECYTNEDSWYEYFSPVKKKTLEKKSDHYLFTKITETLSQSKYINKKVILAFDQVYKKSGELDKENTKFYVPNRFVYQNTKKNDRLLFGASIHPYRADLISELDKILDKSALVYISPSLQKFDLQSKQLVLMANKLYVGGVPLMIDMDGVENYEIEPLLETGVKIILSGQWMKEKNSKLDKYEYFSKLTIKYKNLFASVDSLPIFFTKVDYDFLVSHDDRWKDRLVYGSGYPKNYSTLFKSWFTPISWGTPFIEKIQESKNNKDDYTYIFKKSIDYNWKRTYQGSKVINQL